MAIDAINAYVLECIRRVRIEKGLRVQDMAQRTGIPLGSYSCLETGRYRMSLENLFRILHVLGMDISDVWPSTNRRPKPVKKVDDAFIRETVEQARGRHVGQLSLDDILEIICDEFAVSRQHLASPSRRRDVSEARTVAAVLVREQRHLTMVSLSRVLRRDVSTLAHCMRRLKERLKYDRHLAERIKSARRRLKERTKDAPRPRLEERCNAQ